MLPLSKRTPLQVATGVSLAPASGGGEEVGQPLTVTCPTLFDPLFAQVAIAELFTV